MDDPRRLDRLAEDPHHPLLDGGARFEVHGRRAKRMVRGRELFGARRLRPEGEDRAG